MIPAPRAAPPAEPSTLARAFTPRAMLLSLLLTLLCGIWVRQAEIVVLATQVTESVPPVPAMASLLILVGLAPSLPVLGRLLRLTRGELIIVYSFVSIAISMSGPGVVRFWVALVTVPFYLDTPTNGYSSLYHYIPSWLAVKDKSLIHQLYEGSHGAGVPWSAWLFPLIAWTAFLMTLWFCLLCLMMIVRRRWVEAERLTFPIVKLPLELTAGDTDGPPFLRNPIMWSGFALSCLYNALNILHAVFPTVPAPGKFFDLGPVLQSPPWSSLAPLTLHYRPDLIGFGFLVPLEVCFSIWFFYLLGRLEAIGSFVFALNAPGAPFEQEQSIGAFLLLGVWFLWLARVDILAPFRTRIRRSRGGASDPPLWAPAGLFGSYLFLCWFCARAGMVWWAAAVYLAIILLTALVSSRIRAEAGIPLIWLFPFYQQKKVLLYTLGASAFISPGAPATLTIFALMTLLARGYLPALSGYQIESLKMADETAIPRNRMAAWIMVAALVGFALAFYIHLTTYYHYGAQNLNGVWGEWLAVPEFDSVVAAQQTHLPPDVSRTFATLAGAALTLGMVLLRRRFVGFPLHPLGYAVATSYGSLVWWSFLVVWVLKSLILKWGGMRLYRRAIPFFLGFALGHFFAAGMVWGLVGAFWRAGANAYPVWFG